MWFYVLRLFEVDSTKIYDNKIPVFYKLRTIFLILLFGFVVLSFYNSFYIWILSGFILLSLFLTTYAVLKINLNIFVNSFSKISTNEKVIALTFDDGPHSNTPEILKLLEENNAKATFFLIGKNISKQNEKVVKSIAKNGHDIGNHSFFHRNMFPFTSEKKMRAEISTVNTLLEKITCEKTYWFRPPFGITNPLVYRAIKKEKMQSVGWSVRSFDTVSKSAKKSIERVTSKIKPGSIVLLHDHPSEAIHILKGILYFCKQNNYSCVTVRQLAEKNNELCT